MIEPACTEGALPPLALPTPCVGRLDFWEEGKVRTFNVRDEGFRKLNELIDAVNELGARQ
jgi:hypothetical protein